MIEAIRKSGIITKGIIYFLVGILTLLSALDMGGKVSGKNEVISFLKEQTFGNILLVIIAVGLAFYAFWRLYSAFLDGKNEGSDKTGILKRIGYFFSGLIYGSLSVSIISSIISRASNSTSKESATEMLINNEGGIWILYVLAIVLLGVGFYQFYKGYSYKFLDDINKRGNVESESLLRKSGLFGHIARGISFAIFGFFVYKAANEKNAEAIKGIQEMFSFLREFSWGNILMGLMAVGFILYGIYQYFLATNSSQYKS